MDTLKNITPGAGITITIAIMSFLVASLHPSFDALIISIIFGMLVSNLIGEREVYEKGVDACVKIFLPVGIALYGMQLKFAATEPKAVAVVVLVIAATFLITYLISRGFGLGRELSLLLGAGLSICGASAIIVISPLIGARKEDTSISLLSVMTLGLSGMLLYSFVPDMVGLGMRKFAFLTGATLPMLGQVKVAASYFGRESLGIAMNLKLLRISSLLVFSFLAIIIAGKKTKRFYIPWFMVVFFALAAAVNLSGKAASMREAVEPVSRFFLTVALSAMGLSIDFDSILEHGTRPLFSVVLSWSIVVLALYILLGVVNV
jgi:uncharacterized integral membrane protein (TIGR00698 family)